MGQAPDKVGNRHAATGLVRHLCVAVVAASLWTGAASGTADAATSEASASAIAALNAGTAAIRAGRSLEAIDYLNSAIESGALSAEGAALAYHHRGIAHQKLGLSGHAVADYTNAIWQGGLPEAVVPRSYYNRAVAYAQMGQQDRAERDYDKAIELAPDYAAAYHNRGNLRRHLGRNEDAVADYARALDLGMGEGAHLTYFARALSYNAIGNRQAALSDTRQALALKPDFTQAKSALAEWGGADRPVVAEAAPAPRAVTPPAPTTIAERAPAPIIENEAPIVTSSIAPPTPSAEAEAPRTAAAPVAAADLDAVRVPAQGRASRGPVTLTPPRVAAIEPQTGNVSVAPLSEALPPPREDKGWEATVTRYARPPAQSARAENPNAAVPPETVRAARSAGDDDLTTASIDRSSQLPSPTTASGLLRPSATGARPERPIVVAQNAGETANDAGSGSGQRPLRVQVGSFRSASDATSAWNGIAGKHGELVGQRQPYIVEADLGERGIFYRLQMGPFGSMDEAKALCRALKARGQDCIIAAR